MKLILYSPGGLEDLVKAQVAEFDCDILHMTNGEVRIGFDDPTLVYRLLIELRHVARVVLPLSEGVCDSEDDLYRIVQKTDWTRHLPLEPGFRVDVFGSAQWIRDARFPARVIKDAIVDQFYDRLEKRPDSGPRQPVRIEAKFFRGRVSVGINLNGEPLDRRGYRIPGHPATLRESLAAAVLDRARWTPELGLFDPFCGGGTLVIEAALRAANQAPGLFRGFAIEYWKKFKPESLKAAREKAIKARRAPPKEPLIWGRDLDPEFVALAQSQARLAGVADWIRIEEGGVEALPKVERPAEWRVVTNPPWGKRLNTQELVPLYEALGQGLKAEWAGTHLSILCDRPELAQATGLRVGRSNSLMAGPDKLTISHYDITGRVEQGPVQVADDLAARLKKRFKHLKKWADGHQIEAFRVYDADLPEYNFVIDYYQGQWHMAEYEPPKKVDPVVARRRRETLVTTLEQTFEVSADDWILKTRAAGGQYDRGEEDRWLNLSEENARFRVNLTRYNDTGLFLDHRGARRWLAKEAAGKDCLNLFAYTATASVRMALGGAKKVASVDLNPRYCRWAEQNFRLNGLNKDDHPIIQADCIEWLRNAPNAIYDLVLLDPPTFSNSARTETVWDVRRDISDLLQEVHRVLRPGGAVLFSTNAKGFKLQPEQTEGWLAVQETTAKTRDQDCPTSHRAGHKSWWLRR